VRVGISLLTLAPGDLGGSETYARALVRALSAVGRNEYRVFVPRSTRDAAATLPAVAVSELPFARRGPPRIPAMRLRTALSREVRSQLHAVEVLHYPLTVPIPDARLPKIVTLQDVLHHDLPEHFSAARRRFRRRAYDHAAQKAEAVIVLSEFVRERAIAKLGLDAELVHVIPHGVDHALFAAGDEPRRPFLLYPARPWPHKNHAQLFHAFAELRTELPELRLVLTGGGLERLEPLPEGVERLGLVPVEELASLYRTAACLVFPSLYEGFGLPPLEAMACGCPVAAANAAAIPEICGDAAVYFDPHDPEAIANGVREALALADELHELGLARASRFTWEESARSHDLVYGAVGRG
jgi:glycosyltransferase involved in cell wall biosynthesis